MHSTRWVLAIIGIMLLVSCGGNATNTRTPDQVHTQFLAALQANDRQAVLDLVADDLDFKTTQVDGWLQTMQEELNPPADLGMTSTGGNLHDQVTFPIVSKGEGAEGYSLWPYADRTICHITMLARTQQGWRVVDWGNTTSGCKS